eukprot:3894220-Pyramimonas_sp.AAC.1
MTIAVPERSAARVVEVAAIVLVHTPSQRVDGLRAVGPTVAVVALAVMACLTDHRIASVQWICGVKIVIVRFIMVTAALHPVAPMVAFLQMSWLSCDR